MGAGNPFFKPIYDGVEPKTYYVEDTFGEDFLGFDDDLDRYNQKELFNEISWAISIHVKELKPLDNFEMLGYDMTSMGRFLSAFKISETDDGNIYVAAAKIDNRTMLGILPIGFDDFYEKIQFTNNKDSEALRKITKFDLSVDDEIINGEIEKAYKVFLKKVYTKYVSRFEKALKKSELGDYTFLRTGAWTSGNL